MTFDYIIVVPWSTISADVGRWLVCWYVAVNTLIAKCCYELSAFVTHPLKCERKVTYTIHTLSFSSAVSTATNTQRLVPRQSFSIFNYQRNWNQYHKNQHDTTCKYNGTTTFRKSY